MHSNLHLFKRYVKIQVFMQFTETAQKLTIKEKHMFSVKYAVIDLLQLIKSIYQVVKT